LRTTVGTLAFRLRVFAGCVWSRSREIQNLQIACNTVVTEGMVINNNSEKVKDTVKWGLDFHLINHPLDCPICDQAGECGLQEQYMEYGKYDPEMAEKKVKKRKVVDLGPTIVLDTERCILCSRCVRFTEEVTETNELGIFNRGDRSEIGTFKDKPLANKYSLNTVDICPVGALTSKDFRFRQRVWYLKEADSICPGCSTGCSIKVYLQRRRSLAREASLQSRGQWLLDVRRRSRCL
jgi:NADH-quinone oxidoreductase subunit G